jgi:iron-sulfur cluster insertion protein
MDITITDKAVKEVKRILEEQSLTDKKVYLRLRVVGQGCAGFSHKLDLDEEFKEGKDETWEINGINVVVDNRSSLYLDGVIVDFHSDLNKRGFSITNSRIKSSCGCGSSFQI